jgi:hypothetical protein
MDINGMCLVALLDSGSTHNFVDTEATTRVRIKLHGQTGLCVAVTNGDRLTSLGSCNNLQIGVGDESFSIACYRLALGSFDMVLEFNGSSRWGLSCGTSDGAQWHSCEMGITSCGVPLMQGALSHVYTRCRSS